MVFSFQSDSASITAIILDGTFPSKNFAATESKVATLFLENKWIKSDSLMNVVTLEFRMICNIF